MRGFWGIVLLAAACAPLAAHAGEQTGRVTYVIDGDTLVLESGEHVRLLDINTPEIGHGGAPDEPLAQDAKAALAHLALGRKVEIETGRRDHDQYGRLLGHVYVLPQRAWVNAALVREGFAHVYTFADNALHPKELLAEEAKARQAKRGLWALPQWQVRDAATCCAKGDIGTFKLVEGRVLGTARVKTRRGMRTYLNFGRDWRTDFSVAIDGRDDKYFRQSGLKPGYPATLYNARRVRVRGYLQPVNGVLVRVTHPAQIEILGE